NTLVLDENHLRKSGFPTKLTVISAKDTTSPKLTALDFTPAQIDTSTQPAEVKLNYTATDDLAGGSYIELAFVSPSCGGREGVSAKLQPARSHSGTLNVSFPRFSEPGNWKLAGVFLADAAGNTLVLDREAVSALGFRTSLDVKSSSDTTPPNLTA